MTRLRANRPAERTGGAIDAHPSKRTRRAVAVVLGLALASPAAAPAQVGPPPITITWDSSCPMVGARAVIPWSWTKKSGLKPSDTLKIQYRPYQKGTWKTIANGVRLDNNRKSWRLEGRYVWDASEINPGKVKRYKARLIVKGKGMVTPVRPFWIDHVPPKVWITEPAAIFDVPGPDGDLVPATVARGWTDLRAEVSGERKWCYRVLWTLQGSAWTVGPAPRDRVHFNGGPVKLWAVAIDRAGNRTDSEPLYVLGLPGNERSLRVPAHVCVVPIETCTPQDTGVTPPA